MWQGKPPGLEFRFSLDKRLIILSAYLSTPIRMFKYLLQKCPCPHYNYSSSLYRKILSERKNKSTNSWALLLHCPQHPFTSQSLQLGFWPHPYTNTALARVANDLLIAKPNEHFHCGAFLQLKWYFKFLLLWLHRYDCLLIVLLPRCLSLLVFSHGIL